MSEAVAPWSDERLLTFEVGGSLYALPIAHVLEVTEIETLACVPTLPPSVGGVFNHHGDALPVFRRSALLGVDEARLPEAQQVLVICERPADVAQLGMPVDRVLGLTEGAGADALGPDPVAERRPIGGRVANVLDPKRLVARAREVIESSPGHGETT